MREILFRGKRVDNGEWVKGDLIHLPNGTAILANGYAYVNPSTIGQFTGLTDKNGNKIFEGDIVSVFVKNRTYIIFNNLKGEVCFKDGVIFIKGISEHLSLYAFSNYCEVIGNIHDNPEQLKGE